MDQWTIADSIKILGQLSTTGVLAYVAWKFWGKLEQKDLETAAKLAAKDAEIAALNEKRVNDLKAIAKQND